MSDQIGQSVIKVVADASELSVGMAQAKKVVEDFERSTAAAAKTVGVSMDAAAKGVAESTGKMDASAKRFMASLERQSNMAGKTRSEYAQYRAAQLGVTEAAAPMIARLKQAETAIVNTGLSSKQTAAAMRLLPAQMTDIVTSVASGMPVWLVAIQQGGQIKDSFGGIGKAIEAVTSLITPMRLAFAAGAAAVGGIGFAALKAADEMKEFRNALITTGNYAGLTARQLSEMSRTVAESTGFQGKAADALTQLAATGNIAGASFEMIAKAAVGAEKAAGKAIKDTVEEFASIAKNPVSAVEKLDEKYNFLTATVYSQIRALVEQGRQFEAVELAQRTFAESLISRNGQMLAEMGALDRMILSVKESFAAAGAAVKGFFDASSAGAAKSLSEVDRINGELLRDLGSGGGNGPPPPGFISAATPSGDDDPRRGKSLRALIESEKERAYFAGERARQEKASIAAMDAIDGITAGLLTKQQQLTKAMKEYTDRVAALKQTDPLDPRVQPKRVEEVQRLIRESFADKGTDKTTAAERHLKQLQEQLEKSQKLTEYEMVLRDLDELRADKKSGLTKEIEKQMIATARQLDEQKEINRINKLDEELQRKIEEKLQRNAERIREQAAAWDAAQASAQEYLSTLSRGFDRRLQGLGLGRVERERIDGRNQIEDKYAEQLLRLQSDQRKNPEKDFTREIELIRSSREKALRIYDNYYKRLLEMQDSAYLGLQDAVVSYLDSARNNFDLAGQAANGIFGGMEDAVVKFAQTGKFEIKAFADVVVAELSRIAARKIVAGIIGSIFGGGGTSVNTTGSTLRAIEGGSNAVYGSSGAGTPLATGTNYVPYDGFKAILHQGEAVVPREYNPSAGGDTRWAKGGSNTYVTLNVHGVKDEGALKRSSAQLASRAARAVSMGGRNL